ncbi:MAG: nucleotidyltransferase family protein, partial [Elusimicrobia bacterium]|nr:nucleotidyltransferase family protein [Elusimicrobiota bacterium]
MLLKNQSPTHPAYRQAGNHQPRNILVHNLLLFKELENLLERLNGIPVMLLKGGALLLSGVRGYQDRSMEDLDLLVQPRHFGHVVGALKSLGYRKFPKDPAQFRRDGLAFDLHDRIWYLTEKETQIFWDRSRIFAVGEFNVHVPAPQDLFIHVLTHAAVHHGGEVQPKWMEDVEILARRVVEDLPVSPRREGKTALGGKKMGTLGFPIRGSGAKGKPRTGPDWQSELKRLGLWLAVEVFLSGQRNWWHRIPVAQRGHFMRFWFLRNWRFRLKYLWEALFPRADFLKLRYDLRSSWQVFLWRFFRP